MAKTNDEVKHVADLLKKHSAMMYDMMSDDARDQRARVLSWFKKMNLCEEDKELILYMAEIAFDFGYGASNDDNEMIYKTQKEFMKTYERKQT